MNGVTIGYLVLGLGLLILALLYAGSRKRIFTLRRTLLDLRTAQEVLDLRYARAQSLLDALPVPFVILDNKRRILMANPATRVFVRADLVGQDITAALRHPAILEAITHVSTGQSEYAAVECAFPSHEGRIFAIKVDRLNFPAETGALLLTFLDITDQRAASRMRTDFVANASHELRTPLAALSGMIETLLGPAQDDPPAQKKFLLLMQAEATRMSALVADLLTLSRVEGQETNPVSQSVDLRVLVKAAAQALRQAAERNHMTIRVIDLSEPVSSPVPVLGETADLAQMIRNLLDNAIKYGRNGTEVAVSLDVSTPGFAAIRVQDHGDGIPARHIPRLTERFYRVDDPRNRKQGGTGLGLAIVKHILKRHAGRLEISSVEGEGSVFTAILPLKKNADPFHKTVTTAE